MAILLKLLKYLLMKTSYYKEKLINQSKPTLNLPSKYDEQGDLKSFLNAGYLKYS